MKPRFFLPSQHLSGVTAFIRRGSTTFCFSPIHILPTLRDYRFAQEE